MTHVPLRPVGGMMTPVVTGYYRLPPIWVGDPPSDPKSPSDEALHETILLKRLECGIVVRVQKDGLFMFDFWEANMASPVHVPAYNVSLPVTDQKNVQAHAAEETAESVAVLRALILNVHQACLSSAGNLKTRGTSLPHPVTYQANTYKALDINDVPGYSTWQDPLVMARTASNGKSTQSARLDPRFDWPIEIIEDSLTMLDAIILKNDAHLLSIIETIFVAGARSSEKRRGESVVLSWTACEQLISVLWERYAQNLRQDVRRGSVKRLQKMKNGSDFTASMRVEILEIAGQIPATLYASLETARKARNNWAHKLREPTLQEVIAAHDSAAILLRDVYGIIMAHFIIGPGGVPMWGMGIWQRILDKRNQEHDEPSTNPSASR